MESLLYFDERYYSFLHERAKSCRFRQNGLTHCSFHDTMITQLPTYVDNKSVKIFKEALIK
ncbi:hypothetical protein SELSPUOL_02497 [Selenomonas sputigena ATCC 35185]|uniref:Uncharacterized protein n=1 Tax=Selenomonas sputigena (strain ATCC 35185 / DSM 20758 / CCUG 44933 / VPI D19B-28) TaxID=546271 RepID=C9LYD8_SELS3|nr:hypothetical protein SELSPUOL_02497 [Selenomonas sputigena ATCC 35185]